MQMDRFAWYQAEIKIDSLSSGPLSNGTGLHQEEQQHFHATVHYIAMLHLFHNFLMLNPILVFGYKALYNYG